MRQSSEHDSGLYQPRKRPVQARSRATYDRIVSTASHLFNTVGYERTSMNSIAIEADVSPGTLYQYFPNREPLLLEIFDRELELLGAELFELYVQLIGQPFEVVVRRTAEHIFDQLDAKAEVARAVSTRLPRSETFARIDHLVQRARDVTRAHLAAGGTGLTDDPDLTIWLALGVGEGIISRYIIDPPRPREHLIDQLVRIAVLAGEHVKTEPDEA